MLTLTSAPDCPSFPPKRTFPALAPYQTQMTLASTTSALAASYLFLPTHGIGLVGLVSTSPTTHSSGLGGLISQPDPPILGGLPLTHADFCTHRAPLPQPHIVGSIGRPHVVSTGNSNPQTLFGLCRTVLGLLIQDAREANRDLCRHCPIAPGLSLGFPQWVHRVRRFGVSFTPPVFTSAFGPRRLQNIRFSGPEQRTADASGTDALL